MTAIIEREEIGYSALCPEYDIASQGATIEEARDNLVEALPVRGCLGGGAGFPTRVVGHAG